MREVMSGKISNSAPVAAKLAERLTQLPLAAREHAVLKLVAEQSMPNKLITDQLGISEATVRRMINCLVSLVQERKWGRADSPQEIADTVVFLASSRADYINGQNLRADGGYVPTVN